MKKKTKSFIALALVLAVLKPFSVKADTSPTVTLSDKYNLAFSDVTSNISGNYINVTATIQTPKNTTDKDLENFDNMFKNIGDIIHYELSNGKSGDITNYTVSDENATKAPTADDTIQIGHSIVVPTTYVSADTDTTMINSAKSLWTIYTNPLGTDHPRQISTVSNGAISGTPMEFTPNDGSQPHLNYSFSGYMGLYPGILMPGQTSVASNPAYNMINDPYVGELDYLRDTGVTSGDFSDCIYTFHTEAPQKNGITEDLIAYGDTHIPFTIPIKTGGSVTYYDNMSPLMGANAKDYYTAQRGSSLINGTWYTIASNAHWNYDGPTTFQGKSGYLYVLDLKNTPLTKLQLIMTYSGSVSKVIADSATIKFSIPIDPSSNQGGGNDNPNPPPADVKAPIAHISTSSDTVHNGDTITITGSGIDPQDLKIIDYEWSVSDGQTLSGTGGQITINGPTTVTLKVENEAGLWSEPVSADIGAVNHPPNAALYSPGTVVMGDDFSVNASGTDPDNDPLTYSWDTPPDFIGSASGYTASGYFDTLGNKTFSVTVTDPFGASDTAAATVNVVPPIPNVIIDKSGTEKENRKITLDAEKYSSSGSKGRYTLDWSKAKWQFYDSSGNELTVDSDPNSDSIVKALDSTTGTKAMNLIFKKVGKYTAKCTLYNTAGYSSSFSVDLNITQDIAPLVDFNFLNGAMWYRDGKDLSPNGLAEGTATLVDNSASTDHDSIGKRMWLACFDSDNDGSFITITNNEDGTKKTTPEQERWYVYDLDYNGDSDTRYKVQVPDSTPLSKYVTLGEDGHKYAYVNDSLNPHWRYVGSFADVQKLDINKINCGNLTSVSFKSTSVGYFDFEEEVQESFGQETIPELITNEDFKTSNTWANVH